MNSSHFVRTDWFYRTIYWFCFVVLAQLPNPLRVLSKTQPWGWSYGQLAMGYWLWDIGYGILAMGYWLWVMGYWWLAIGYGRHCRYPCLYTLHPTFYLYTLHFTFYLYTLRFTLLAQRPRLSPLASSPIAHCLPKAVFWRRCEADARAVRSSASQNRWSVWQNIISSTEGR